VRVFSTIAAVVYEVTDEDLSYQEHLSSTSEILEVLHSKISTLLFPQIQKASVTFLCSYYDSLTLENGLYNVEDLIAVKVPREFAYVKELLNIEGDLRTMLASGCWMVVHGQHWLDEGTKVSNLAPFCCQ
jgi:hypothetical protein